MVLTSPIRRVEGRRRPAPRSRQPRFARRRSIRAAPGSPRTAGEPQARKLCTTKPAANASREEPGEPQHHPARAVESEHRGGGRRGSRSAGRCLRRRRERGEERRQGEPSAAYPSTTRGCSRARRHPGAARSPPPRSPPERAGGGGERSARLYQANVAFARSEGPAGPRLLDGEEGADLVPGRAHHATVAARSRIQKAEVEANTAPGEHHQGRRRARASGRRPTRSARVVTTSDRGGVAEEGEREEEPDARLVEPGGERWRTRTTESARRRRAGPTRVRRGKRNVGSVGGLHGIGRVSGPPRAA